jgi:hypothetical protein
VTRCPGVKKREYAVRFSEVERGMIGYVQKDPVVAGKKGIARRKMI